ncbi:MAG: hypothetical protein KC416_16875, partial [Myxococcales bacterium]|nr:hypothetical protein [Myxococcales bacterium]
RNSVSLLRLLQSIHGHLGVLATVALLHPAILLRHGAPLTRGRKWAVGLSVGLVIAAFAMGLSLYDNYRAEVRRTLFSRAPSVGLLFETKEHLAYAVLALSVGAFTAAWMAGPHRRDLRRGAAVLFATAAVLCGIVAAIGTYVAAFAELR